MYVRVCGWVGGERESAREKEEKKKGVANRWVKGRRRRSRRRRRKEREQKRRGRWIEGGTRREREGSACRCVEEKKSEDHKDVDNRENKRGEREEKREEREFSWPSSLLVLADLASKRETHTGRERE